jgi:periplasmic protein CpxP/Spy
MKTSLSRLAFLAAASLVVFHTTARADDTNAAPAPKADAPKIEAPAPPPGGPPRFQMMSPEQRLARMSEQLTLTEEQKPKVKALLEEQDKQRAAVRELAPEERRGKMQAAREEMNKKMKEILTEEQFKNWEALRPGRGQGRPPGPPPAGPEGKPAGEKNADAPKPGMVK